jgi:hypothetical protein
MVACAPFSSISRQQKARAIALISALSNASAYGSGLFVRAVRRNDQLPGDLGFLADIACYAATARLGLMFRKLLGRRESVT